MIIEDDEVIDLQYNLFNVQISYLYHIYKEISMTSLDYDFTSNFFHRLMISNIALKLIK